jgi:hypothetical protein
MLPDWIKVPMTMLGTLAMWGLGGCLQKFGGVALCMGLSGGCSIFDTGPRMSEQVGDVTKTLVLHAVDGLKAQTGQVTAEAELNDPHYRATIAVGPVWLIDVELSLTGAKLEGLLQANLIERAQADPAFRAQLIGILTQTEMSEQQKMQAILQLIRDLAGKAEKATVDSS